MRHLTGPSSGAWLLRLGVVAAVYLCHGQRLHPDDLAACRIIYSDHDQRAAYASRELATNDVMVAGYDFQCQRPAEQSKP